MARMRLPAGPIVEISDKRATRLLRAREAVLERRQPMTIRILGEEERVRTTYCSPEDENFRDELHRQHDIPRIGGSRKLDPEFMRYRRERARALRRQSLNNEAAAELHDRNAAKSRREAEKLKRLRATA